MPVTGDSGQPAENKTMNTITKSTVLEADKLATLYAGKLREAGNSPSNCLGVTSDKVLPMEFQNGVLCRSMLPDRKSVV